jgi:hypothetical protein
MMLNVLHLRDTFGVCASQKQAHLHASRRPYTRRFFARAPLVVVCQFNASTGVVVANEKVQNPNVVLVVGCRVTGGAP